MKDTSHLLLSMALRHILPNLKPCSLGDLLFHSMSPHPIFLLPGALLRTRPSMGTWLICRPAQTRRLM